MGGNGSLGHTHVKLRLGIVDAVPHTPFLARRRRHAAPGIGGGLELRSVGNCNGPGVVLGIDSGGRVELYVSATDESVSIGDRRWSCSVDLVSQT